jgi:hypothetical protein
MTDAPNGNGREGRSAQAHRWLISLGTSLTVALASFILATVKETASDVTALKIQMSTLTATQAQQTNRLDAIDRRNDQQDVKIDELQRRVWRLPEVKP